MTAPLTRPRGNSAILAASAALFALFAALAGYQKYYANRVQFTPDANLLDELASATLLEEDKQPARTVDWPQWRGPRRDGVAHDPDLPTRWPPKGPRRLWQVEGGEGFSSFAVRDGRLYTLVRQDDQEVVLCLRADSGKEVWRHAYDPGADYQYGGPRATPTLDGDRVYTVGCSGLFFCLEAATGKVLWRHDLRAEFNAPNPTWGFAFSPLVEGDLVYTQPGGRGCSVAAFNKETGAVAWQALDEPAGYSSPIAVTAGGLRQVVFFTGDSLIGVSPKDGTLYWRYRWKTSSDVNAATPLSFRALREGRTLDYLFISSGYGRGCALLKVEADGAGGAVVRPVYESNELCTHFSSPVRYRDCVYGIDETRDLTCLDLRTGKPRWRQHGFNQGSVMRIDDHLLVLGKTGKLALVRADPEKYRAETAANLPRSQRYWTVPVLADGLLFVRDERKIFCLDLGKR